MAINASSISGADAEISEGGSEVVQGSLLSIHETN